MEKFQKIVLTLATEKGEIIRLMAESGLMDALGKDQELSIHDLAKANVLGYQVDVSDTLHVRWPVM